MVRGVPVDRMDSGTNTSAHVSKRMAERRAASHKDPRGSNFVCPVLVAVDVSWHSRAALLWACDHAANADVPVTILHVLHDPAEMPGKYSRYAADPFTPMADTAERMLSEFMDEMRENHPALKRLSEACTNVVRGLPARTIVDEAIRLGANLIVLGSRGHMGAPRLIYGSTAQKVVQLSPIPVTVVKASG